MNPDNPLGKKLTETPTTKSLAKEYQDARHKCLTTSFKIKSNSKDARSVEPGRPDRTAIPPIKLDTTTPTRGLTKEYQVAKRSYATSKVTKSGELVQSQRLTKIKTVAHRHEQSESRAVRKPVSRHRHSANNEDAVASTIHDVATAGAAIDEPKIRVLTSVQGKENRCNRYQGASNDLDVTNHTVDTACELIGLKRPDDKKHEHGLADGIQLHLIESIKLAGLRKAREKSIMDMITTLCNHLSNREDEISQWIQFADSVVVKAAQKLSRLMLENAADKTAIEDYCTSRNALDSRIDCAHGETQQLKDELSCVKSDIARMLHQFNAEYQNELKRDCSNHNNRMKTQGQDKLKEAIALQSAKHNDEKMRLESQILSLSNVVEIKAKELNELKDQLNITSLAANDAHTKQSEMLTRFDLERQNFQSKLSKSEEEISRLQNLLEQENSNKEKELKDMEEKMNGEFDAIELKVKRSMKLLTESKDKEIKAALTRAIEAERILSELNAAVLPVISSAEDSGEK